MATTNITVRQHADGTWSARQGFVTCFGQTQEEAVQALLDVTVRHAR